MVVYHVKLFEVMKRNKYIQPVVEITATHAAQTLCVVSEFSSLVPSGGTETVDPSTGGL